MFVDEVGVAGSGGWGWFVGVLEDVDGSDVSGYSQDVAFFGD